MMPYQFVQQVNAFSLGTGKPSVCKTYDYKYVVLRLSNYVALW